MLTKTKLFHKALMIYGAVFLVLATILAIQFITLLGLWAQEAPGQDGGETTVAESSLSLEKNPYGPEDFAYEGDYLTCLAGQSVLGIDVSYWQGQIDWQQVKAAGVEFVMLRLGWRGSEQGLMFPDDNVEVNYRGAKEAGLQVGGYFFSQAISVEEARQEAEFVLDLIGQWEMDMPIVFDWERLEDGARTQKLDGRTITDCTKAFCEAMEKAGFTPMIYFNPDLAYNYLALEELAGYRFWLAMYDHPMDFPYRVDMWQYTAAGTVPGIEGNVDLNLYFP